MQEIHCYKCNLCVVLLCIYLIFYRSLYDEDCLLFATLLCLNIEAEGMENFSNEEMSLLLQGIK